MEVAQLQATKSELERAFLKERDSSKWTKEHYDELCVALDKALEWGLGEPRDKLGIGAVTLVQEVLHACNAYEKAQIKIQLSKSMGPDDIRVCNGKTVIIEECARILSGLNNLSQQSWNDAVVAPEVNEPIIFQNSRIETMSNDVRSNVILIRKAYRRMDGDMWRVEDGLRMVSDAVSQYDRLVQRVESEVTSRERLEADARINMNRTKPQTTAAIAQEMSQISSGTNATPTSLIHDDQRRNTLMQSVAARATAIEMVDLQHILAEQMQQAVVADDGRHDEKYDRFDGNATTMPTDGEGEQFAQSLFGDVDGDTTDGAQATPTTSKLRAKRSQRLLEQRLATNFLDFSQ
ncbi:hypothetical protein H310_01494 [Aphanomyces invadans]|uniref:Uncharacterized protein n=1 Tax=Aphanomyces invadans TaxID=157072 RepID=A0A024USU6_9STRA|nr:hypothetical protein H310_01494 [Aphanomyces invadans]ETW09025.1 hypothetical protein H310_01494 [Aphanomyces invadans]|eukprot:XP_008862830.1 hypothetical protein H310_01494 [Aphanomyces invadans]